MPAFDLPLAALRGYAPAREEPADFDGFWADTLAESRALRWAMRCEQVDAGLRTTDVFDVEFAGFAGQPIRAWLLLPAGIDRPLPCVIEYSGYGGGRGLATERLLWSAAGYAYLLVDSRGQQRADTADLAAVGVAGQPAAPGLVTQGISDPRTYYYRRLITDAVLAVDAARDHPDVDPGRIVVAGTSQGGGLALAVAGLDDRVGAVVADVPFLCNWRRAVEISTGDPYREVAEYVAERRADIEAVLRVLSYVDGVNFAARAGVPALFSVGLEDEVCPPSTVFAAYNHYAGPKRIAVFEHNGHEGGGPYHDAARLAFVAEAISTAPSHLAG
jgi:cephalosporin-C deacetylase